MKLRLKGRKGFTMVEVMMSIAVMTIGAMGIVALQHATVAGTRQGREMSTATNITEKWLDRVREDALRWQTQGAAGLAATNYLTNAPAAIDEAGDWFLPVPLIPARSFAADYFGQDEAVGADMVYCTELRLNWLAGQNAIRVDARTWWHRTTSIGNDDAVVDLQAFAACANAGVTADLNSASPRLHAVYGSTVVRWHRP